MMYVGCGGTAIRSGCCPSKLRPHALKLQAPISELKKSPGLDYSYMLYVWCDRCDLVNRPVTNGERKDDVRGSDHEERSDGSILE